MNVNLKAPIMEPIYFSILMIIWIIVVWKVEFVDVGFPVKKIGIAVLLYSLVFYWIYFWKTKRQTKKVIEK